MGYLGGGSEREYRLTYFDVELNQTFTTTFKRDALVANVETFKQAIRNGRIRDMKVTLKDGTDVTGDWFG
jgi:hypothetical protein